MHPFKKQGEYVMMGFQEGWVSILSRTLVCGTVGLGYVGLPLAVEKAKAGFKTIGFIRRIERMT